MMRYLLLLALAGCASGAPVVRWTSTGVGLVERIELKRSGEGNYVSTLNGVEERNERVVLSGSQVQELDDLLRSQGACQLRHEPDYKPGPEEGQTTLELAFPDQTCKVVLSNSEWQRGPAHAISETMRSMRPIKMPAGRVQQ
jgi:hypothetical protein